MRQSVGRPGSARPGEGPVRPGVRPARCLVRLALALCWAASLARGADDAAVDECVQRLEQGWRWSELDRDVQERAFSLVSCIDGFLHAADREGVWRYDGLSWQQVDDQAPTTGDPVTWLGHVRGTLVHSDGKQLSFPGQGEARPPRRIAADAAMGMTRPLALDDGTVLVAVEDRLAELTADGLEDRETLPAGVGEALALTGDRERGLWCATTAGGLLRREPGGPWRPVEVPDGTGQTLDLKLALSRDDWAVFLPRIFTDRDSGLVWDGVELRRLDPTDAQGQISDAIVLPSGRVLVALQHSALLCLDPLSGRWSEVDLPFSNDDAVRSLTVLPDGRCAVVDSRGRLFVFDGLSTRWSVHDPSPTISRIVNAIAPAREGGVWIATHDGIGRFDGQAFVEGLREAPELGLALRQITAIHEDSRGVLWLGSGSAFPGLLRRDGQGWRQDTSVSGREFGAHALVTAPDGSAWALMLALDPAGDFHRGALLHQEPDGSWTRLDTCDGGKPLPRTYSMVWAPDGTAYVGTLGGLLRLEDGRLTSVPGVGLAPDESAFCLAFGGDGTLWLGRGRRSPGLSHRTPDGVWHHPDEHSSEDPASWACAGAMAVTHDGRVWISGELGLFLATGGQLVRVATEGVGNMSSFWPVLPTADRQGLWIGSLGSGLASYRPDDVTPPRTDDVWVESPFPDRPDNTVVRWSGADAWGVTPRERLFFGYRLGGQKEWSPWSLSTSLPAFGFAPGEHLIEVRAMDEAGNEEREPRRQVFRVGRPPPSIWTSEPMLAAYAVLLVLLAALALAQHRRGRERRRAAAERQRLSENLRELTRRLMTTQEDERRHLARDLHDDLGQLLTLAGLQIDMADKLPEDADRRREALSRARLSTSKAMDSVRNLAAQIRPTVLDDLGLESALSSTLEDLASSTGLTVRRTLDFRRQDLPADVASHAFRIVNESLTNAVRHAQADELRVELSTDDHQLTILVQDDGVGFETDVPSGRHGIGLLSMRERAEALGGRLEISSAPGQGTTLTASLPLPPSGPPKELPPW